MKNKSMWTVHNSFWWWWPLRVHTMVHFDMNWSGDNLLTIFSFQRASLDTGGFHMVAKIIRELKSHMIPYKFKCSHWW